MLWLWLACKLPTYDTSENRPEYTVECGKVECPNADSVTSYYSNSHITCIWNCVNYEDNYYSYLEVNFGIKDGCYQVESITVDPNGICSDWNFE